MEKYDDLIITWKRAWGFSRRKFPIGDSQAHGPFSSLKSQRSGLLAPNHQEGGRIRDMDMPGGKGGHGGIHFHMYTQTNPLSTEIVFGLPNPNKLDSFWEQRCKL